MPAGAVTDKDWESWRLSPPPEGHAGVGRWVYSMMRFAHKYRENIGITEVWRHNHELYRNRFFKNPRPKITQVPVNLVFKTINRLKAELTDNEPQASIEPRGEAGDAAANAWGASYEEWWEATKQQDIFQESVGLSELYGCQVDEVRFNPELAGGLGEVETVLGDNFGFISWPGYVDLQKAPMHFKLEAIELDTIYRQLPDIEGEVKSDSQFSTFLGEDRRETRGNVSQRIIRPYMQSGYPQSSQAGIGSFKPVDKQIGQTEDYGVQKALVVTCWVKDYTEVWVNPITGKRSAGKPKKEDLQQVIQQPVMDPMTQQPILDMMGQPVMQQVIHYVEPHKEQKYPGFLRRIRVTNKGALVLDDLPNPSINPMIPRELAADSYLWDKFPFIKRLSYSDGLSEYGLSIIEQIEPLVMEIAQILTKVSSHLKGACDPFFVNPKGSGVEKRDINNLPNRILNPTITTSPLLRYMEVPNLPGDYLQHIKICMLLIDLITGLTDVTEGRGSTGVTAFAAIAALQEKAQAILREKIRHVDTGLEEHGRMYISLGQNWYTFERKVKYSGGQGEQAIEFKGVAQQFQGQFAFRVEAGSTLPQSKWALREMYLKLAEARMVDQQAVLEVFNIPKYQEILQRMQRGPLMMAAQRLQKTGLFNTGVQVQMTPQLLDALMKIIAMPEKDFIKLFPQAKPESIALGAMMQAGLPSEVSQSADKIFKAAGPMIMANQGQPQQGQPMPGMQQ